MKEIPHKMLNLVSQFNHKILLITGITSQIIIHPKILLMYFKVIHIFVLS